MAAPSWTPAPSCSTSPMSTFKGNTAYGDGGAVYAATAAGPVYVTGSTFGAPGHGNTATTGYGGAIDYAGDVALTVNNTKFSSNVSQSRLRRCDLQRIWRWAGGVGWLDVHQQRGEWQHLR